jgi:hypothetical protein
MPQPSRKRTASHGLDGAEKVPESLENPSGQSRRRLSRELALAERPAES